MRSTKAWGPLFDSLASAVRGARGPDTAGDALRRWADRASAGMRGAIRDEIMRADLAGRSHAVRVDAGGAPVALTRHRSGLWLLREDPGFDVGVDVPFTEAIDAYREQGLLDDSLYAELLRDADEQANARARDGAASLADRVHRSLLRSLEDGGTIEDFVRGLSRRDARDLGASYAEAFFRTAIAQAYTSGRVEQMDAPELQEALPYVQLVAIIDDRTTSICEYLNGLTFDRVNDPGWSRYAPPNHYSCRTDVEYLTSEQLDRGRLIRSDRVDERGTPQPPFDRLKA